MSRSHRDFDKFYQVKLVPVLEKFENRRKKISKVLIQSALTLVSITGLISWYVFSQRYNPWLIIVTAFVTGFIGLIIYYVQTHDFVKEFKLTIIKSIVSFIDKGLNYEPEKGISEDAFTSSLIFTKGIDRYHSEDYVTGRLGQTDLEFSEVKAEYKTQSRGKNGTRTHWHTIFEGLFFIADFHKHFHGHTIVLPDLAENLFGGFGRTLQSMNLSRSGKLVRLEDPEFEKEFVVYSSDQVEARYILSPSMMQRISKINRESDYKIYLSFVDSKVFVGVETNRNNFEPSLFSSLLKVSLAKEFLVDFELMVGLVEELNLNTRIWSK